MDYGRNVAGLAKNAPGGVFAWLCPQCSMAAVRALTGRAITLGRAYPDRLGGIGHKKAAPCKQGAAKDGHRPIGNNLAWILGWALRFDEVTGCTCKGGRATLDRGVSRTSQGNNSSGQNDPVNCYGAVFVFTEVFDKFDHCVSLQRISFVLHRAVLGNRFLSTRSVRVRRGMTVYSRMLVAGFGPENDLFAQF